jgi:hypothetical protein
MSSAKDGGSDSNAAASASAGAEGVKNKTAKMSMDAIIAENASLKLRVTEKDTLVMDLTKQLKEANDVLDGQEREKLITYILPRSSCKQDVLAAKTTDALKEMKATLDVAMPPKVNSVRFGGPAADISDREKGLTVGDLSFSTMQKRKAARGVV